MVKIIYTDNNGLFVYPWINKRSKYLIINIVLFIYVLFMEFIIRPLSKLRLGPLPWMADYHND